MRSLALAAGALIALVLGSGLLFRLAESRPAPPPRLVARAFADSPHPAPRPAAPAARTSVEVHYSPAENLEKIDVALIDAARVHIDMAAYVLTDRAVIEALARAARRGVAVRIDRTRESDERYPPSEAYLALRATPGIAIRAKRRAVYMHLKSYAVDGVLLRTGAANFSASGLKQQDNDLVVIRDDPAAIAGFAADFARLWDEAEPEK